MKSYKDYWSSKRRILFYIGRVLGVQEHLLQSKVAYVRLNKINVSTYLERFVRWEDRETSWCKQRYGLKN